MLKAEAMHFSMLRGELRMKAAAGICDVPFIIGALTVLVTLWRSRPLVRALMPQQQTATTCTWDAWRSAAAAHFLDLIFDLLHAPFALVAVILPWRAMKARYDAAAPLPAAESGGGVEDGEDDNDAVDAVEAVEAVQADGADDPSPWASHEALRGVALESVVLDLPCFVAGLAGICLAPYRTGSLLRAIARAGEKPSRHCWPQVRRACLATLGGAIGDLPYLAAGGVVLATVYRAPALISAVAAARAKTAPERRGAALKQCCAIPLDLLSLLCGAVVLVTGYRARATVQDLYHHYRRRHRGEQGRQPPEAQGEDTPQHEEKEERRGRYGRIEGRHLIAAPEPQAPCHAMPCHAIPYPGLSRF